MAKRKRNKRSQSGLTQSLTGAGLTIDFEGATFPVADKVGLMPLMRFAHLARQGVDASDLEGLTAMYDLLQNVIADEAWPRFQAHAAEVRADSDMLLAVVQDAIAVMAGRPTRRPSDSSDGPSLTSGSSAGDSSSRVIRRLEREGRPSIALMVVQAQESRSVASA